MAIVRCWHFVTYDVREDERLRKVHQLLRAYGDHVQYSVFRVHGGPREIEKMRWELEQIMEIEDALLIVPVCASCASRVVSRGSHDGWNKGEPRVALFGEPASTGQFVRKRRPRKPKD